MSNVTSRQKLSKAPLTLVLCQVRFSAIRTMASFVPDIQTALRKAGYRLDISSKIQEVLLRPQGQQVQVFDRWEFANVEKTRSVILTEEFAAYQTTAYTTFEEFIPEIIRLMNAVTEVGADVVVTRVGLRYIDAIIPASGRTWRDYLTSNVHGIHSDLQSTLMAYHLHGTSSHGRILARVTQNTEGLLVPLDLAQMNLAILRPPPPPGSPVTLLDIDHFKEWTKDFTGYEARDIERLAWDLKHDIYTVFRALVTDSAIEEWR